jgi:hypothetical protein
VLVLGFSVALILPQGVIGVRPATQLPEVRLSDLQNVANAGSNPPAASAPTMAYDPADGYTVLFGGAENGNLNETWTFARGSWTDRSSSTSPPPSNAGNGLSMTYDPADGYVLLSEDSQTWSFHGGAWTNRTAAAGVHTGIGGGFIGFDPNLNATVLFGENFSSFHSYTWLYQNGVWENATRGSQPGFSSSENLVWDSTTSQLDLIGCASTFAFENGSWTALPQDGSTCITGGVNVADDPVVGGLLAYGGSGGIDFGTGGPGVTWTYIDHTWASKNITPCPQIAGGGAGMAFDAGAREVILFGGFGRTYSDQTWTFANDSWKNVTAPPFPPIGVNLAAVFEIVGGVVLVAVLIAGVAIRRPGATRRRRP